jgi:hypothetical protein
MTFTIAECRARAEPDGTRAETTFRLSPKRTSPFKSAGYSVQFSMICGRLLAAKVCASALVMLDTPSSEVVWEYWLPNPFVIFPFTSPPVRHRVPPHSERSIQWINSWWWTGELSETCRVPCQNKFVKLVYLVGFIIRKLFSKFNYPIDV